MRPAMMAACWGAACGALGCEHPATGTARAPIVDGTPGGNPSVVFLVQRRGMGAAACTGSVIAPRVVLTAYHCVDNGGSVSPPEDLLVLTGDSQSAPERTYRVEGVRPVPNPGTATGPRREPNDVALLLLAEDADEAPIGVGRDLPDGLVGKTITAVGYGEVPKGSSGAKYTTTAEVQGVTRGLILVEPAVCSGDSGGPMIGGDGLIYGVASFIFSDMGEPQCGTAPGAYNAIHMHLDHIDQVLDESGFSCTGDEVERCNERDDDCDGRVDETLPVGFACDGGDADACKEGAYACGADGELVCSDETDSQKEACNGDDDDCDGEVDEGCLPAGAACEGNDECVGGRCARTEDGRRCRIACESDGSCPAGLACRRDADCEGYCLPDEDGPGGFGDACTGEADCASPLACLTVGGSARCWPACRGDSGECLGGEVCSAVGGNACGACVPTELGPEKAGLGEGCARDEDCRRGLCLPGGQCASDCDDDEDCPAGFACRAAEVGTASAPMSMPSADVCVREGARPLGGACGRDEDCASGWCADVAGRRYCTRRCIGDANCPRAFFCEGEAEARSCTPERALEGEACKADGDCVSGRCADGACTTECSAREPCGPGFECARGETESALCRSLRPAASGGGCAIEPAPTSAPFWVGGLLLSLLLRRRRGQR